MRGALQDHLEEHPPVEKEFSCTTCLVLQLTSSPSIIFKPSGRDLSFQTLGDSPAA